MRSPSFPPFFLEHITCRARHAHLSEGSSLCALGFRTATSRARDVCCQRTSPHAPLSVFLALYLSPTPSQRTPHHSQMQRGAQPFAARHCIPISSIHPPTHLGSSPCPFAGRASYNLRDHLHPFPEGVSTRPKPPARFACTACYRTLSARRPALLLAARFSYLTDIYNCSRPAPFARHLHWCFPPRPVSRLPGLLFRPLWCLPRTPNKQHNNCRRVVTPRMMSFATYTDGAGGCGTLAADRIPWVDLFFGHPGLPFRPPPSMRLAFVFSSLSPSLFPLSSSPFPLPHSPLYLPTPERAGEFTGCNFQVFLRTAVDQQA